VVPLDSTAGETPSARSLPRFARAFAAALAGWFKVRLKQPPPPRRVSDEADQEARERCLRGLAALYAETAHEMSTPLTTIALVLGDLRSCETPPPDWRENLDLLWGQVQICRRSLAELALAANLERLGNPRPLSAKQLMLDVGNRFRALRPTAHFRLTSIPIDDSLSLQGDEALSQALLNFLNRAADLSPDSVELQVRCDSATVAIEVLDRGPGVAPVTSPSSGRGSGTGLLIAQAVVERFGGTVQRLGRAGGGSCVQIELPLSRPNLGGRREDRESQAVS